MDLKAVETDFVCVASTWAEQLVGASSRTPSAGCVGPGGQGLRACPLPEWLGRTRSSKGSQLNLPGLGERLTKSLRRDPFLEGGGWGREKVAVAALLPAASSLYKVTVVRTQTFAHLPSPFLEMFGHSPP